MNFKLSDKQRNELVAVLGEVPAKVSFNALSILVNLPKLEEITPELQENLQCL